MPLPCATTLNNWGATFSIPPGILTDVLHIMKEKEQNLCTEDKLTVLTFDELYISKKKTKGVWTKGVWTKGVWT
ncbi:unnamed protein product [Lasius platythorax]